MKLSVIIFSGLLSYSSMKTYIGKKKVRFTELIVTCCIHCTGVFFLSRRPSPRQHIRRSSDKSETNMSEKALMTNLCVSAGFKER